MSIPSKLSRGEVVRMYRDTEEIIEWLTVHGTPIGHPDGAARTKLDNISEGKYLASEICIQNIRIPPTITQALERAIPLWKRAWEDSMREYEDFVNMWVIPLTVWKNLSDGGVLGRNGYGMRLRNA